MNLLRDAINHLSNSLGASAQGCPDVRHSRHDRSAFGRGKWSLVAKPVSDGRRPTIAASIKFSWSSLLTSQNAMTTHPCVNVPQDCIATLHAGPLGRLQLVHCSGRADSERVPGYTRDYHFVVPLAGAFIWHRGVGEPIFANSNSVVHVGANDDYTVSHPVGQEVSAVFWPRRSVLAELVRIAGDQVPPTTLCTAATQMTVRRMISSLGQPGGELKFEESSIDLFGQIHAPIGERYSVSQRSMRLIDCAKAYLHAHVDAQLGLSQIAEAVGVSPVYLTQLFRRSEGVPLYRYHLDLRLNRALDLLPTCDDITDLALDLGFSSHAHFSTEFRRRFGVAPSAQRDEMRFSASEPSRAGFAVDPLCAARGGIIEP